MLQWLSANLGTIFVALVLLVIVGSIIRFLIRQKRQGKSTCGGDCSCCGACKSTCHSKP